MFTPTFREHKAVGRYILRYLVVLRREYHYFWASKKFLRTWFPLRLMFNCSLMVPSRDIYTSGSGVIRSFPMYLTAI